MLLETHLSLWLASTTFLEDKGRVSVYCKLNGLTVSCCFSVFEMNLNNGGATRRS